MNENGFPVDGSRGHQNIPALFSADPSAIAAAELARAQIQTAYMVAMQRPRDIMESRDAILMNCRRPRFAERAVYAKPVGGRKIVGPSVRFAEVAVRAWRNVLTQTQVVYEDDLVKRIKVTCIDLESNVQYTKESQVNKTVERKDKRGRDVVARRINSNGEPVYIVRATEDELHNKVESVISKAVRNEGLRLIPADIVDEAMDVVRDTLAKSDSEDPEARLKSICDAFARIGVKPKAVASYLGHSLDEPVTVAELADLRAVYTAINSGESTWAEVMDAAHGAKPVEGVPGEPGQGMDALRTRLDRQHEQRARSGLGVAQGEGGPGGLARQPSGDSVDQRASQGLPRESDGSRPSQEGQFWPGGPDGAQGGPEGQEGLASGPAPVEPGEGQERAEEDLPTGPELLDKVRSAKAKPHLANIVKKYRVYAESIGYADTFLEAVDQEWEKLTHMDVARAKAREEKR